MTRADVAAAVTGGADGVHLLLEVTAGARGAAFPAGYNPWRKRIGIRVAAPARDGEANDELRRTIAAFFRVGIDQVVITQGATSALKTVRLVGATRDDAIRRLEAQLS